MTQNEAFEILGISNNASGGVKRAAMQARLDEVATPEERKVIRQAYNIAVEASSFAGKSVDLEKHTSIEKNSRQPKFDFLKPLPKSAFENLPIIRASRTYTGAKHKFKLFGFIPLRHGHEGPIHCASIAPDDQTFMSGGFVGTKGSGSGCFQWRINEGIIYRYQHGFNTKSCDISKDGQYAVTGGLDGMISVFDYQSGEAIKTKKLLKNEHIYTVNFIGETTDILVGGSEGATIIWEPFGDTEEDHRVEGIDRVHDIWVSPSGNQAIIVSDSSFIHIVDFKNRNIKQFHGEFIEERGFKSGFQCLVARSDARTIVCTDGDKLLRCYISDERVHRVHETFQIGSARALAISPNEKFMITGFRDNLLLWNLPENRPLSVLSGHEGEIKSAVFSADSSFALSTDVNSIIKLWRF